MLLNELNDDENVFNMLACSPFCRSFPRGVSLEAAEVLRRVLVERRIPRNLADVRIKQCFERGWLPSEATDPYTGEDIVCFFPLGFTVSPNILILAMVMLMSSVDMPSAASA